MNEKGACYNHGYVTWIIVKFSKCCSFADHVTPSCHQSIGSMGSEIILLTGHFAVFPGAFEISNYETKMKYKNVCIQYHLYGHTPRVTCVFWNWHNLEGGRT